MLKIVLYAVLYTIYFLMFSSCFERRLKVTEEYFCEEENFVFYKDNFYQTSMWMKAEKPLIDKVENLSNIIINKKAQTYAYVHQKRFYFNGQPEKSNLEFGWIDATLYDDGSYSYVGNNGGVDGMHGLSGGETKLIYNGVVVCDYSYTTGGDSEVRDAVYDSNEKAWYFVKYNNDTNMMQFIRDKKVLYESEIVQSYDLGRFAGKKNLTRIQTNDSFLIFLNDTLYKEISLQPGETVRYFTSSNDGTSFAYVIHGGDYFSMPEGCCSIVERNHIGGYWKVYHNNKFLGNYQDVRYLILSEDGEDIFFEATIGGEVQNRKSLHEMEPETIYYLQGGDANVYKNGEKYIFLEKNDKVKYQNYFDNTFLLTLTHKSGYINGKKVPQKKSDCSIEFMQYVTDRKKEHYALYFYYVCQQYTDEELLIIDGNIADASSIDQEIKFVGFTQVSGDLVYYSETNITVGNKKFAITNPVSNVLMLQDEVFYSQNIENKKKMCVYSNGRRISKEYDSVLFMEQSQDEKTIQAFVKKDKKIFKLSISM